MVDVRVRRTEVAVVPDCGLDLLGVQGGVLGLHAVLSLGCADITVQLFSVGRSVGSSNQLLCRGGADVEENRNDSAAHGRPVLSLGREEEGRGDVGW